MKPYLNVFLSNILTIAASISSGIARHAYDVTVETIIAFRKRLIENKVEYGNLRFYFTKMGEECKKLLKSHIYDGLQLKDIALALNEAETNIRKRKERCMNRLKSNFFELYVP